MRRAWRGEARTRWRGRCRRIALLCAAALAATVSVRASLAVYMAPEHLAARAPLVVEGTVVRVASGLDPDSSRLATYVTLAVDTVHRGPRALDELVLREPGGRFGDVVHEIDAVPVYRAGERVLAFLEPAPDGALRTSGMFFGKFTLDETDPVLAPSAARDLEGQGLLPARRAGALERIPLADLLAVVAAVPPRQDAGASSSHDARPLRFLARPPEYDRLLWEGAASAAVATPRFVPLSSSNPTRWFQSDSGTAVKVHVEPDRDPLGDPASAVAAVGRAIEAWTGAPEARVELALGDPGYDFTGTHGSSPVDRYYPVNVVLFGDPYEDIVDPTDCTGVVAIGGYWRTSSTGGTVNGVTFHSALSLYVVFNDGFACILGDPDNLAELAAHELGHGLGFGHSFVYDALMRPSIYGARGARLGDDDRDAAHCTYPHGLTLLAPNGGETWEAGSTRAVAWSSTPEAGADAGSVTLEHSKDGGATWSVVADGVPNDGSHSWVVPDAPGGTHRLRVIRHSRAGNNAAPFPEACSGDASNGSFAIVARTPVAGAVPDGSGAGEPLRLARTPGGDLVLSWGASCSEDAADYAVYEGSLGMLRTGVWDPAPALCSTAGAAFASLTAAAGDRYFLVAARAGELEGSLGRASDGTARPPAPAACAPRETLAACE